MQVFDSVAVDAGGDEENFYDWVTTDTGVPKGICSGAASRTHRPAEVFLSRRN
jgi:hypothetical protein